MFVPFDKKAMLDLLLGWNMVMSVNVYNISVLSGAMNHRTLQLYVVRFFRLLVLVPELW